MKLVVDELRKRDWPRAAGIFAENRASITPHEKCGFVHWFLKGK